MYKNIFKYNYKELIKNVYYYICKTLKKRVNKVIKVINIIFSKTQFIYFKVSYNDNSFFFSFIFYLNKIKSIVLNFTKNTQ